MKLLVSDKEFQNLVKDARAKLDVPKDGLTSDLAYEEWQRVHYAACDAVLLSHEYGQRGRAVHADFDAGKIDKREFYRRINLHNEEVPINRFRAIERFIVEKFDLPENYQEHISRYILKGDVTAPYHNFIISTVVEDGARIARKTRITFFTIPTEEDMRLAKRQIDRHARHHGMKSYRPMKNIDRDLRIEDWYLRRERFDPVEQKFYKAVTSEIAKEHLGSTKKTDDVRYIVKDLGKARKKRFHGRGKTSG